MTILEASKNSSNPVKNKEKYNLNNTQSQVLTTASLSQTLQKQSEFNQSVVDAIKSRRKTQQDTDE